MWQFSAAQQQLKQKGVSQGSCRAWWHFSFFLSTTPVWPFALSFPLRFLPPQSWVYFSLTSTATPSDDTSEIQITAAAWGQRFSRSENIQTLLFEFVCVSQDFAVRLILLLQTSDQCPALHKTKDLRGEYSVLLRDHNRRCFTIPRRSDRLLLHQHLVVVIHPAATLVSTEDKVRWTRSRVGYVLEARRPPQQPASSQPAQSLGSKDVDDYD